ncbi:MAG: hypothetical protein F6J95_006125 [Leptolyngbya sp. SIO1E4]|nr:hypothetical protein [Leptolyngbya sp. SIO1E4]
MRVNTFSPHRPYPLVLETVSESGGVGVPSPKQPRLIANWMVGKDGKLICQWSANALS